jgi:hypothetical protein
MTINARFGVWLIGSSPCGWVVDAAGATAASSSSGEAILAPAGNGKK